MSNDFVIGKIENLNSKPGLINPPLNGGLGAKDKEIKRLKSDIKKVASENEGNCPMCHLYSGVSDETLKQMKEKVLSKCH